jgi:hypothetical protein
VEEGLNFLHDQQTALRATQKFCFSSFTFLHEPVPLGFVAVSGIAWYYILAFANDDETG